MLADRCEKNHIHGKIFYIFAIVTDVSGEALVKASNTGVLPFVCGRNPKRSGDHFVPEATKNRSPADACRTVFDPPGRRPVGFLVRPAGETKSLGCLPETQGLLNRLIGPCASSWLLTGVRNVANMSSPS